MLSLSNGLCWINSLAAVYKITKIILGKLQLGGIIIETQQYSCIYAISDAIGETAEAVAQAAASQFNTGHFDVICVPYVNSTKQIIDIVEEMPKANSMICHTLVDANLRVVLNEEAAKRHIPSVDIMGPMLHALSRVSGQLPKMTPGLIHQLNSDYFQRVEAIEFAVKYDDGKNPLGILLADIVLVGVSRTSKTPLSMYLANKRFKVTNIPLVPEVEPPAELFQIPPEKIIGLIIDPMPLNDIRRQRLKVMGLSWDSSYASMDRILEELEYAKRIMKRLRCRIIDVSNRAVEETASRIVELSQSIPKP